MSAHETWSPAPFAAAFDHRVPEDLRREQGARHEVRVEVVAPCIEWEVRHRLVIAHRRAGAVPPGGAYEHVALAQFALERRHRGFERGAITSVGLNEYALPAGRTYLRCSGLSAIGTTPDDRHSCPVAGEPPGDRPTQGACGPDDGANRAGEIEQIARRVIGHRFPRQRAFNGQPEPTWARTAIPIIIRTNDLPKADAQRDGPRPSPYIHKRIRL